MSKKSKHESQRKAMPQKAVAQRPLKSSWGAAVVSFLKDFFLNSGDSWYSFSYEENLNNEGKRKKSLIWNSIILISAVLTALLPFYRGEFLAEETIPTRIFLVSITETAAIGMGISSIVRIKNAIKIRWKNKEQKDKCSKAKN